MRRCSGSAPTASTSTTRTPTTRRCRSWRRVGAFSELVNAGKVRAIGVSNYTPERIDEWLDVSARERFHRARRLQPHYNLVHRGFESTAGASAPSARVSASRTSRSRRASSPASTAEPRMLRRQRERERGARYLDERGVAYSSRSTIAAAHGRPSPCRSRGSAQPNVVAPIASARTVEQLGDLLASLARADRRGARRARRRLGVGLGPRRGRPLPAATRRPWLALSRASRGCEPRGYGESIQRRVDVDETSKRARLRGVLPDIAGQHGSDLLYEPCTLGGDGIGGGGCSAGLPHTR